MPTPASFLTFYAVRAHTLPLDSQPEILYHGVDVSTSIVPSSRASQIPECSSFINEDTSIEPVYDHHPSCRAPHFIIVWSSLCQSWPLLRSHDSSSSSPSTRCVRITLNGTHGEYTAGFKTLLSEGTTFTNDVLNYAGSSTGRTRDSTACTHGKVESFQITGKIVRPKRRSIVSMTQPPSPSKEKEADDHRKPHGHWYRRLAPGFLAGLTRGLPFLQRSRRHPHGRSQPLRSGMIASLVIW